MVIKLPGLVAKVAAFISVSCRNLPVSPPQPPELFCTHLQWDQGNGVFWQQTQWILNYSRCKITRWILILLGEAVLIFFDSSPSWQTNCLRRMRRQECAEAAVRSQPTLYRDENIPVGWQRYKIHIPVQFQGPDWIEISTDSMHILVLLTHMGTPMVTLLD